MVAMMLMLCGEKSCEIKGGGQEMVAAISWLPPLISQLFSPRLF